MSSEKTTGRAAFPIAWETRYETSSRLWARRTAISISATSSITIAPSTSRPKSMAPSDMRFPVMPIWTIPMSAIPIASGMASAAISAPRKLPSVKKRTTATRSAPSARLMPTVLSMRPMNSARS